MTVSLARPAAARTAARAVSAALRGATLQLKCACGNHAAEGECRDCRHERLQRKAIAAAPDDRLEREADEVAERLAALSSHGSHAEPAMHDPAPAALPISAPSTAGLPSEVSATLRAPGRPLDAATRAFFGRQLGHDFSAVRVHTGAEAAASARALGAQAYTVGRDVVFGAGRFDPAGSAGRRLLAHELTHVVQQAGGSAALQRKVVKGGSEMTAKERAAFVKARKWSNRSLALEIVEDMAAAADAFDFANDAELESELHKRLSTVAHMKESQQSDDKMPPGSRRAFGYPFTGDSLLYGPRVNYAAREFWEPAVPDGYALRTDKAKNAELRAKPRHERCAVYGDPCGGYGWKLSKKGQGDAYHAIAYLFAPQPAHKRSLLHCDYLISLVNFMSLADTLGAAEFNKRVAAFGADKIVLRWNAFTDLHVTTFERTPAGDWAKDAAGNVKPRAGLGSTQRVKPSSEADFVLGDHVVFFNHLAYDLVNERVGNAWRLENAVLVSKVKGRDVFLGHGSGYKTTADMREKLAAEYNEVADKALALTAKARSTNAKVKTAAEAELAAKFPRVKLVGKDWRIQGIPGLLKTCPKTVDVALRRIKPSEVLGPKSPCDPTQMNEVERPVESAP